MAPVNQSEVGLKGVGEKVLVEVDVDVVAGAVVFVCVFVVVVVVVVVVTGAAAVAVCEANSFDAIPSFIASTICWCVRCAVSICSVRCA